MNDETNRKFNEEITRYKNTLLFYAKKCEWDTFKINAGKLFDYCESFEARAVQNEFFKISKIVVAGLFFMLLVIIKIDPDVYPGFARAKELLTLIAIAGCCFEVYFFFNFRTYMQGKTLYYKKRRDKFIRNILMDFQNITAPSPVQITTEPQPEMQPV